MMVMPLGLPRSSTGTQSCPGENCTAAAPCTSGFMRNRMPSSTPVSMVSRGGTDFSLVSISAYRSARPTTELRWTASAWRCFEVRALRGQTGSRTDQGCFSRLDLAPLRIAADFRIVDQDAGAQVAVPQRLQQLLLLALDAQLGDPAEHVREGPPLGFRGDVAPDLERVPAHRADRIRPELQDVDASLQAGCIEQLAPDRRRSPGRSCASSTPWWSRTRSGWPPRSCRSRCHRRRACA